MVDVEQRALRPFEHDLFAVVDGLVQQDGGIRHERRNLLGGARVLLVHGLGIERLGAEQRVRDGVLLVAGVLDMRAQQRRVQQVDDAQAAAMHLVFIRGADAAAGGADLRASRRVLCCELDHAVVGKNDLRAVGDEKLPVDSGRPASFSFFTSLRNAIGSSTTPLPITPLHSGRRHAAGNQLQDELLALDDDGVPGVVAAGIARDDGELLREHVDDLAFALIAPLGTQNNR